MDLTYKINILISNYCSILAFIYKKKLGNTLQFVIVNEKRIGVCNK